MITTENTSIQIEPNIKFIQELIDDLDKAAERKILTYFKNLMKTVKPRRNSGIKLMSSGTVPVRNSQLNQL